MAENYIAVKDAGWINDDSTGIISITTGIMQTGWKQIGNKWYYLRSS